MALSTYKKKRSFNKTPEPQGGKPDAPTLRFVVQKHDATRLHYDFRLEMEGVLKSWAVPKGPSLNPEDKRLAMMVEDHPYDYRDFEGIIPKGNYGAGTVIVWDEGTYEPLETSGDKKKDEKALLKQLKSGSLKFSLHGEKLKGEFALVKLKNAEDNAWLLIKHRDKFAKAIDVTRKVRSVKSDKTLEEVEKTSDNVWGKQGAAGRKAAAPKKAAAKKPVAPKKEAAKKEAVSGKSAAKNAAATRKEVAKKAAVSGKSAAKKAAAAKKEVAKKAAVSGKSTAKKAAKGSPKQVAASPALPKSRTVKKKAAAADLKKAPKAPFPKTLSPMLATLVDKPFDEPGWLYEIKWDGYRAVALCNKGKVELISRNNKSFNDKFYPVFDAVSEWGVNAVVDGEICVINDEGVSNFGRLQNWRSEADGQLMYYVFDLLWLDGKDLTGLPLTERRALLAPLMPKKGIIRMSDNFDSTATEFLAAAAEMGLEGIIAKKANSLYHPGDRTREWIKLKINKRHEVVIGGFTKNEGTSKAFSSLLVGVYEKKKLKYTGKIGTGFNTQQQKEMMELFKPLITDKLPFDELPDVNKPSRFRPDPPHAEVTWLKPQLVCEVSYTEITSDGVMRHPSFEGMREDKKASSVGADIPISTADIVEKEKPNPARKLVKGAGKASRKTLLNPSEKSQVREVSGHELSFTNLDKVYWPKEGYTKRDMLNYYYQVAPYILPYLVDRPQSLNRYPNGINGKSFYQKDVTGKVPDWVQQFPYHTSDGEDKNFMVPQTEADLLYMANTGAIEMNPWNSTIHKPDNPDWCCLDLDPDTGNTFEQVIQTAQTVKEVLDEMGIHSFPKTSGSTGIHIYIPLAAKYDYDQCQLLGKIIATEVHARLPKFTSIERMTRNRKGKIYIDYLQNRAKATLAAAYSLRPKPGATVSMPLDWSEVKKGLKLADFNITNAVDRVKRNGDLFKGVLGRGVNLKKLIE